MPWRWRVEAGYTLVEVLAAVAIVGIALIPLLGVFSAGLDSAEEAYYSTIAINLAQAKIDELRYGPYRQVISSGRVAVGADYPGFYRTVEVVVESPRLKKVTVTVDYQVRKRTPRPVHLITLIAGGP
jgi:prepilin-type N-terminal cleavage/methylation domain-containing protein